MASTIHSPMAKKKSLKTGWLRKQGGMVRSWHRRWFVLNGDILFYFSREDDAKPLGTIYLPGNRIIEHAFKPDEPEKFLFEIIPGKGQTRMTPGHETYLICANSEAERKEWIKHIRRVMFQDVGGAIFGLKIEETMAYEKKKYPGRTIPWIIEQCVEFLTENGLETEGIFRLPGRTSLIRELKETFDCGERLNLDTELHDLHTVASLLKLYLRELPESLIPNDRYQKFMNIALRFQEKKQCDHIADLRNNLSKLPEDNYNILEYLCRFVHKVGQNVEQNKMSEMNLATVFGPNIIRHLDDNPELFMATADLTHQLAFLLIHHHDEIFTGVSGQDTVPVEDLLGLGLDDTVRCQRPLVQSSDILSAVTTELGISFDQNSAQVSDEVSSRRGLLKQSQSCDLPVAKPRPNKRNNVKSLTLPARPIPPKRKSKTRKKADIPRPHSAASISDTEQSEGTPETPERWFDPPESPTSWNGPVQNRGHVVYSEDLESGFVVSSNNNDCLVFNATEALQQQNDVLKESLSRTKSKYESQQKSLIADREKMKKEYDSYISTMEERHSSQLKELKDKLDSKEAEQNCEKDLKKSSSNSKFDDIDMIRPSIPEIHLQNSNLKIELTRTKSTLEGQMNSLKAELLSVKQKHAMQVESLEQQLQETVDKLEKEKAGRAEAVSRIMSLQAQLHKYQMLYGELSL